MVVSFDWIQVAGAILSAGGGFPRFRLRVPAWKRVETGGNGWKRVETRGNAALPRQRNRCLLIGPGGWVGDLQWGGGL